MPAAHDHLAVGYTSPVGPRLTYLDPEGQTRLKAWALPLVVAAICFPIAATFLLAGPGPGVAITAMIALGIVIIAVRSRPLAPREVAPSEDRGRRVLVLVGSELDPAAAARVAELARGSDDVRVLVPIPSAALSRWLSAEDDAREQAQGRLARAAGALTAAGLPVSGSIGDSDPAQAVEDELRSFAADEVVVVPGGGWEHRTEALRNRLALPLTTVRTT
jgi:hypothetical protein